MIAVLNADAADVCTVLLLRARLCVLVGCLVTALGCSAFLFVKTGIVRAYGVCSCMAVCRLSIELRSSNN
jgi:hypothetical protein